MKNRKAKPRIALFAMGIFGGGTAKGIPVLTDLFTRLGEHFEITLYCFGHAEEMRAPHHIKVRELVSWRLPGRVKFALLSLYFLLDHVRKPFDLLFAVSVYPTGLWAVRMGKLVNRKVVVQVISLELTSIPDIKAGNLYHPWLRKITTRVYKETDELVAVAEYQKSIAKLSISADRDIEVLPLRIDPDKFPFLERTVSYPVEFIHIAFYSPVKDQDTMFYAFARVAQEIECHLTVIGIGYELSVHQLLSRLGIRDQVTFVGAVDQSLLPGYFNKAHILLHPARFETGCAVIQEAMASGVAVCGTRVGILADLGDRYAGIVSPKDPVQLADKMLELVHNPELYRRMVKEAYQWISEYNAAWAADNYHAFMERLLVEKK